MCGAPKVQLSRVGDNDYAMKVGCDCGVSYVYQAKFKGVKKTRNKDKLAKTLPPRFGIWEGSIGHTAKLAIGGFNINN